MESWKDFTSLTVFGERALVPSYDNQERSEVIRQHESLKSGVLEDQSTHEIKQNAFLIGQHEAE